MARMVRKQVYIEKRHENDLKNAAELVDRTESDLIRQGIETVTATILQESRRQKALEELLAAMRKRAEIDVPQEPRKWTRDELYEERFERYH